MSVICSNRSVYGCRRCCFHNKNNELIASVHLIGIEWDLRTWDWSHWFYCEFHDSPNNVNVSIEKNFRFKRFKWNGFEWNWFDDEFLFLLRISPCHVCSFEAGATTFVSIIPRYKWIIRRNNNDLMSSCIVDCWMTSCSNKPLKQILLLLFFLQKESVNYLRQNRWRAILCAI